MTLLRSLWHGLTMARNIAANLLFALILLLLLFFLFGGRESTSLPSAFALELDLAGVLVERATPIDPLASLMNRGTQAETLLPDIERVLAHAATDDRVGAVVLNTHTLLAADAVQIERIAAALEKVKAADKPILASGYYFSQPQYLLASYADALYLHPFGEALLTGLGSYQPYFAKLLEQTSIDVHVFRVGKYKAAVEPFLRDGISPEAAEATRELLAQLWGSYRKQIALNRGISEEDIEAYIATLPDALEEADGDVARLAIEARLIDELLTPDAFHARIADELEVDPEELQRVDTATYLATTPDEGFADGPTVALISATGAISESSPAQLGQGIVASEVVELIQQAKDDDDVRALVLHVDSPGGEVLASELIRHELELLQLAGKPVVAAMAGVAASGGYWISATADHIVASANTITGSIGIFGVLPGIDRVLDKAGVSVDGIATHSLAGGPSIARPLSNDMSRVLQASVEQGYNRFVTLVARGRDLDRTTVEDIAQGRVWSGAQALDLGLVDQLGSLQDALDNQTPDRRISGDTRIPYRNVPAGQHTGSLAGRPAAT